MTTTPKPVVDVDATPTYPGGATERTGTVRLKLAALGVDTRAAEFPARFVEFCEQNELYQMEVNAAGDLLILPMTGFAGNRQQTYLNYFVTHWQLSNGGVSASQSSRFQLPTGDIVGPDAAWLTQEHYDAQTSLQRETVIQGAPAFVAEIRSRTDNLRPLQAKMALWMENGARLGWLIDSRNRQVHVYRAGQVEPEVLDNPETLNGEDILPGFTFPVRQYIFDLAIRSE